MIHRELKLESFFYDSLSEDATLKLIDFGSSSKYVNGVNLDTLLESLFYIAPEVLDNKYNEKCDIWSCGVILYVLLCGQPPFNGYTEWEIVKNVTNTVFNNE